MLGLTALVSLFLTDRALSPTRAAYERERRFVSAASHELRTPLAIVRSQAELVSRHLRRLSGPQEVMSEAAGRELADDVDEITDEVDYMTRLVRDLLALARSESERGGGPTQAVDLVAVAEGCVTRLRPQADTNGLALLLADTGPSAHAPVMVRADADRLRRLLLILLENALAYTPSGGRITVSVETQTGRTPVVLLNVADTGKGISPEDLPHVFEPFYRADPARRHSRHSGSGLGLALARQIAHSLGGEMTVKSELGIGSTFTVRLPYSADGDS
jgi:signal transduction histidine kinase